MMKSIIYTIVIASSIFFASCRDKAVKFSSSNIDSIVLLKEHSDSSLAYHRDSVILRDKKIFDTIYHTYMDGAKSAGNNLIKLPKNTYILDVYKSGMHNEKLIISHTHVLIWNVEMVLIDRDMEPYLEDVFRRNFTDTSYCHTKRFEQENLQPKISVE